MFYNFLLSIFLASLGTILCKEDEINLNKRSAFYNKGVKWDVNKPIQYALFSIENAASIYEAFDIMSKNTCFEFVEVEKEFKINQGFKIVNGLLTSLKLIESETKVIFLQAFDVECIQDTYCILHNFLVAFGLIYPHMRYDRDDYVKIDLTTVLYRDHNNFKKYSKEEAETFDTSYDFGSIIHPPVYFLSPSHNDTIIPYLSEYRYMMAQRELVSFNDWKILNLQYCKHKCSIYLNCKNGGYSDIKNCTQCKCPEHYEGKRCEKFTESKDECPKYDFTAEDYYKQLYIKGKVKCKYLIQAPQGYKIEIKVLRYKGKIQTSPCNTLNGVTIKYGTDKGASGLVLCENQNTFINIPGKSNEILISYDSKTGAKEFEFLYRRVFDPNDC
uniref:Metalloendopeptidase n=1 Tax=Parastrongyloides trichosuri TaxID=131310 RepID=A0A0N4ZAB1_PARTI